MFMLKVLFKTIIISLLLTVLAGQVVSAETQLYQYDGKMPFVKMMLTMMDAMGIIDRVPVNSAYGLSGYNNLYSSNPYLRALAMQGQSPGYGNNPLLRSPWLSSPWSQPALNTPSPAWGSPSWGVLPQDSYMPYGSQWSSSDLNGWVNEAWETSTWNPEAETEAPAQTSPSNVPLVQNFNYSAPENIRQKNQPPLNQLPPNQSPLSKLAPVERTRPPPNWQSSARTNTRAKKPSPLRKKSGHKQKPCVTDFCGLKKPSLNGLWIAQSGEMLGINNQRYLWSDGESRYLTGQIKVQNEYLLASVDEHETLMRFKYKLAGNHLLTLGEDGTVREFVRMPTHQARNY